MNIYTKGGDKGKTSLVGGTRVSKDDPRVNAYGNVDELISHIALIRADAGDEPLVENLRQIQATLMTIAAHFAADEAGVARLKPMDPDEIQFLESQIDLMVAELPEQTAFILPAGPRAAAECHIARTVCRRAERSAISLIDNQRLDIAVKYLNRLSDYLFVYGRYIAFRNNIGDDFWHQ